MHKKKETDNVAVECLECVIVWFQEKQNMKHEVITDIESTVSIIEGCVMLLFVRSFRKRSLLNKHNIADFMVKNFNLWWK